MAPKPANVIAMAARSRMSLLGADKYESQIRGNSADRAASRLKLLKEFGNGKTCSCSYCGLNLDESTVTRDKIYTAREGGRYVSANLIPACLSCNQSRGDVPFKEIKWLE